MENIKEKIYILSKMKKIEQGTALSNGKQITEELLSSATSRDNNGLSSTIVKGIRPNINWNINTKTSVKGLFGAGCFVSLTRAAIEASKDKDRNNRTIGFSVLAGAVFGGLWLFMDNRDKNQEVKIAKAKHPGPTSSQIKGQAPARKITSIPPRQLALGQNSLGKPDYDKWQLVGKLIGIEDICIIYSETGIGKSILTFQIANDIVNGTISAIQHDDQGEHIPQSVIFYDTELKGNDYDRRYPGYISPEALQILIDSNFISEDDWIQDVEKRIMELGTDTTVVLDNITSAFPPMAAEQMRHFIKVKLRLLQDKARESGFRVTFIIVAHTTKDGILAGSANFQNFATSIIHFMQGTVDQHREIEIDKNRNYGEMKGKHFLLKYSEEGIKHYELECELPTNPAPTAQDPATIHPAPILPESAHKTREEKYPKLNTAQVEEMEARVSNGETKKAIAQSFGIPDSYVNRYLKGTMKPIDSTDNKADNTPETEDNKWKC